jgi:hypothetical protein
VLIVARFVGLLLGAANFGLSFAHAVEMAPKRRMTGPEWLTTQQSYRDFGKVGRVTLPAALASTLATARLVRSRPAVAALTLFDAVCAAATVAIWAIFNEPVNREIVDWRPDALPSDWAGRRDQWEFAHAASAAVHFGGLSALVAAALIDKPARGAAARQSTSADSDSANAE